MSSRYSPGSTARTGRVTHGHAAEQERARPARPLLLLVLVVGLALAAGAAGGGLVATGRTPLAVERVGPAGPPGVPGPAGPRGVAGPAGAPGAAAPLPISLTEHLPRARPGFHCGATLPPAGQECDQEDRRFP